MEEIKRHIIFSDGKAIIEGGQLIQVTGFGREVDLCVICPTVIQHISTRSKTNEKRIEEDMIVDIKTKISICHIKIKPG